MAYNAARTLATVAIRCEGYRVKQTGGAHYNTFRALNIAMGADISTYAKFLDRCREKRNELSYETPDVVSETDAAEFLERTKEFQKLLDEWIAKQHPEYA